ncbi:Exostosin-2 [Orchesella cincta]|uniref:Exostosin-2 n=1 Tax=Orchesella cincta TaxID=48709 RepID=A0A1D2NKG5_ORCCI|nr:Exostosin-2 [Orchesella cincta]
MLLLIVGAVLAYLLYFLPSYPPVNLISYHKYQQQQKASRQSAILSSSSSVEDATVANHFQDLQLVPLESAPVRHVSKGDLQNRQELLDNELEWALRAPRGGERGGTRSKCSMFTCFDIHRCGAHNGTLSVYIYPIYQWMVDGQLVQQSLSQEFYQFLMSIKKSPYYVPNPNDACIFVPTIDLLNLNKLTVSSEDVLAVLSSLEFWGNAGRNHVLLTMFPGNSPLLSLKTNAIIASAGLFVENYRLGFHVPVISPSPLVLNRASNTSKNAIGENQVRNSHWIAVAPQGAFTFDLLSSNSNDYSILFLDYCHNKDGTKMRNYSVRCSKYHQMYQYPDVLKEFDFCLVIRDLASPVLWEVMSVGCIPVIVADHQRLPFDEVIDWRRSSVQLYEHQMHQLSSIINSISESRRRRLKKQVKFIFDKYFSSMNQITMTLLTTLKDKVFSHYAMSIHEWNGIEGHGSSYVQPPLFNPIIAPRDSGFTAVILAYERVPSLFTVIQRVSQVPSLVKILVIWNNQLKDPPSLDSWPKVGIPVKIIRTKENKMSNRFIPYDEIETEAVFAVDDDIVMLTVDEMEFGFETWREYPDRIVGFPSRSHVWDNSTRRWKYESEWTSEISMVLTGAAFYHKFWHYAYTNELPRDIRDWVDAKMNCEDIAMNFLVSARTGKSPIKVTPRKKFKCPTCSNNEMLSADSGHMVERTECINRFTEIMGFMPLIPTEFRADPVLFKVDGVPGKLKRYHDMGTL